VKDEILHVYMITMLPSMELPGTVFKIREPILNLVDNFNVDSAN
jgi:hypothetical protein